MNIVARAYSAYIGWTIYGTAFSISVVNTILNNSNAMIEAERVSRDLSFIEYLNANAPAYTILTTIFLGVSGLLIKIVPVIYRCFRKPYTGPHNRRKDDK